MSAIADLQRRLTEQQTGTAAESGSAGNAGSSSSSSGRPTVGRVSSAALALAAAFNPAMMAPGAKRPNANKEKSQPDADDSHEPDDRNVAAEFGFSSSRENSVSRSESSVRRPRAANKKRPPTKTHSFTNHHHEQSDSGRHSPELSVTSTGDSFSPSKLDASLDSFDPFGALPSPLDDIGNSPQRNHIQPTVDQTHTQEANHQVEQSSDPTVGVESALASAADTGRGESPIAGASVATITEAILDAEVQPAIAAPMNTKRVVDDTPDVSVLPSSRRKQSISLSLSESLQLSDDGDDEDRHNVRPPNEPCTRDRSINHMHTSSNDRFNRSSIPSNSIASAGMLARAEFECI